MAWKNNAGFFAVLFVRSKLMGYLVYALLKRAQ